MARLRALHRCADQAELLGQIWQTMDRLERRLDRLEERLMERAGPPGALPPRASDDDPNSHTGANRP